MQAETTNLLKIPKFSYRGFEIPELSIGTELIDDLGTNEFAYNLAPKSAPLAWRVALYIVGRDLSLGFEDAKSLPESVKEAGRLVYEDAHDRKARKASGCWLKDGVILLPRSDAPKGIMVPDGYDYGIYFRDIEGFELKGDEWKIKPSGQTKEFRLWFPPGNGKYIVSYNPDTGTPEETMEDPREARVKLSINLGGLNENQVSKEISRSYRMKQGTAAVLSWSGGDSGPLCVDLSHEPWDGHTSVGSFPASRAAERSEAPKN